MQTISLVFLVRPKIPFCRMQFLSSRTSRMRLIFLLPLSQLPENPCCYSTGQCCSPLQTARAMNRFPALVRSSVFFWNLAQKHQNASFLLLLRQMLLYYCRVSLPSESCQICKPFLLSSWFAQNPILPVAVFIQQNEPHETNFCSHSANFPKIHAAIVQASAAHHCELPGLGTVILLSFVRP